MIEIIEREVPVTSGVIDKKIAAKHLKIRQFLPENNAAPWLEHVWSVQWDIPSGEELVQRTVPFPAFNLVADRHRGCAFFGCSTQYSEYCIKGAGQVVGFRFRAAGQSAFWTEPASGLVDKFLPAAQVFPSPVTDALDALSCENMNKSNVVNVLTALAQHAIPLSSEAKAVEQMVTFIKSERRVYRVKDLSDFFQKSERSIQRQFAGYLGLSPKLVIDRFRMHNALDTLNSGTLPDFTELALRLKYFDQSHFTNAFKQMTGYSPKNYAIRTSSNSSPE